MLKIIMQDIMRFLDLSSEGKQKFIEQYQSKDEMIEYLQHFF